MHTIMNYSLLYISHLFPDTLHLLNYNIGPQSNNYQIPESRSSEDRRYMCRHRPFRARRLESWSHGRQPRRDTHYYLLQYCQSSMRVWPLRNNIDSKLDSGGTDRCRNCGRHGEHDEELRLSSHPNRTLVGTENKSSKAGKGLHHEYGAYIRKCCISVRCLEGRPGRFCRAVTASSSKSATRRTVRQRDCTRNYTVDRPRGT
jgi:hypothetical protein